MIVFLNEYLRPIDAFMSVVCEDNYSNKLGWVPFFGIEYRENLHSVNYTVYVGF
jgi:hypothetical protein